jgi:hypothetical protein
MRVTPGAICFSNSSHFALMPKSNNAKPVALPPGAAKLAANPARTGSTTLIKMIGNLRVASWSAGTARLVLATSFRLRRGPLQRLSKLLRPRRFRRLG